MLYQILCGILAGAAIALCVALALVIRRTGELRAALDRTSELATAAQKAAGELGEMATFHERRASEFFAIIEGVERERDGWYAFYRTSSHAAGVAQAWLARELQRVISEANVMSSQLKTLGRAAPTVAIDPALTGVLEDFAVHAEGKNELPHAGGMAEARRLEEGRFAPTEGALPPA